MSFPAYTPKARVQKPAPAFSGTAVVDGTFEGTSYYPLHLHHQLEPKR
jgi:peroxiredoxin (alkyl hydroperoxide reductase subunit C)